MSGNVQPELCSGQAEGGESNSGQLIATSLVYLGGGADEGGSAGIWGLGRAVGWQL